MLNNNIVGLGIYINYNNNDNILNIFSYNKKDQEQLPISIHKSEN